MGKSERRVSAAFGDPQERSPTMQEKNIITGLDNTDTEKARFHVPYDLSTDNAIKTITGEAICHVDEVLGLKGDLSDVFKRGDDLRRGITVRSSSLPPTVEARVIADVNADALSLLEEVRSAVQHALAQGAGMEGVEVKVEVADSMTPTAFYHKYGPDRSCEEAKDMYAGKEAAH